MPPETSESSSNSKPSDDDVPLFRIAQRYRHKRNNSVSEGPISKIELAKHDMRQERQPESESESYLPSDPIIDSRKDSDSAEPMDYKIDSNHASILGQADKNIRHALFRLRSYGNGQARNLSRQHDFVNSQL